MEELNDKEKGKNGGKEYIGTQVRVVTVSGSLNGAFWTDVSATLKAVDAVRRAIRRHGVVVLEARQQGCDDRTRA